MPTVKRSPSLSLNVSIISSVDFHSSARCDPCNGSPMALTKHFILATADSTKLVVWLYGDGGGNAAYEKIERENTIFNDIPYLSNQIFAQV